MDTDSSDNSNATPTKARNTAIVANWEVKSKRLDFNTKQRHQYEKRKRQKKKADDFKRQKKRIQRRKNDPLYNSSSDSNGWTTSEDEDCSSTTATVVPPVAPSIELVNMESLSLPPHVTGITGSEPNSMLGSELAVLNTTVASGNTGSKPNSILGSEHTMPNITDATLGPSTLHLILLVIFLLH